MKTIVNYIKEGIKISSKTKVDKVGAVAKDTGKNPIFSQEERKELVEKDWIIKNVLIHCVN